MIFIIVNLKFIIFWLFSKISIGFLKKKRKIRIIKITKIRKIIKIIRIRIRNLIRIRLKVNKPIKKKMF